MNHTGNDESLPSSVFGVHSQKVVYRRCSVNPQDFSKDSQMEANPLKHLYVEELKDLYAQRINL